MLLIDVLALLGGFALIVAGVGLGIKGVVSGGVPINAGSRVSGPATGPFSRGLSTVSNLSMKAAYKGQFLPSSKENDNKTMKESDSKSGRRIGG